MMLKAYQKPEKEKVWNACEKDYSCRFHEESGAIVCYEWGEKHDKSICKNCGWNPVVDAQRKVAFYQKLNGGGNNGEK